MGHPRLRLQLAGATLAIVASITAPRLAAADRLTLGISVGRTDGESTSDAGRTRGVFGRLRLTDRLALQGEVQQTDGDGTAMIARRLGGAVLIDLAARGRVTPYLLAGAAVERAAAWGVSDYVAREVGLGVDYQLSKALSLGLEGRVGERELVSARLPPDVYIDVYAPVLSDGEYRSLRVSLAASF